MADEGFKRKLAAILSADVEGYSRLMDDDEEATVRTLTSYRTAISDLVQQFRGRVVDSPGDNILAEFKSVVDSVNCAVEIQRELAERNEELPDNRKMQFRIGVNLGDVIDEDGRIYGDGVNIAARVESLAEAGGICISGRAHDQVENKLGLEYEDLGKHEVKNISRPLQVYRVLSYPGAAAHRVDQAKGNLSKKWRKVGFSAAAIVIIAFALGIWQFYLSRPTIEPASVEKMAFPLPDKPSIAVLPFDNLSKDQSDAYIADGLTENIISSLSMTPNLLVIARNSTFVYQGKAVKIKQVAEELGVRYVLEGSIQKSEDKIRVIAQLIDAVSGHHLWSERYDREIKDFFQLLDEITIQITTALRVKLLSGGNVRTASTTNFEAWSHYVKGGIHFLRFTKQDNIKARKLFQQAVKLDPEYVEAWTNLGWTHCIDARNGFTETPLDSMEQAELTAQKASAIDDSVPLLQTLWASLYLIQRQHDKAIVAGQKAIELNPNNANGYALLAQIMFYSNRPDEAITLMQKAMRLSPYPPAYYLLFFGMAYQVAGQYQEAHPVLLKLLDRAKKGEFYLLFAHNTLALNFALMGDYKKAQEHWTEVLKIYPDASLDFVRSLHYFKDPAPLERFLDAYRAAGVAEHPPLKLPDKPSIAVLPFDNMGGDPEHEYIADGFTENIITGLSQIPEMFVIARSSVFTYKGKSVKVQQVSKELGVKYVLEGSIQKAGERLRVNAQLIDAIKGNHLWAEFYDRELKDLFVLLDEIITNILNTLQSKLVYGDKGNWTEWNRTGSFEAWSLATKGLKNFDRITKEDNRKAQKYFEQATKLDSEYAFAWTMLAYTINLQGVMGWSESPADSTKRAREIMQKVSEQWGYNAFLHSLKSRNYLFQGQHEKSIVEGKKAIELVPNNSRFHILLANSLNFAGRPKEAIVHAKKAMRLEPFYPAWFLPALANSYEMLGRYEEAIEIRTQLLKRALKGEAPPIWAYEHLATCYASLGQMADAKAHVAEILKINPNYNVETFRKGQRAYEDQTYVERLANLLIKAGLPE